jgi:hypothetical protein
VRIAGDEFPEIGLVLEEPPGVVVLEHSRPHALGPPGRTRRVVHRTRQRVGRQLHLIAFEQGGQGAIVEHGERRLGVGRQRVTFGRKQGGVEQDGDDAPAQCAEHAHQERRRRREAEGDPVARHQAGGVQGAGDAPLRLLGRHRLEELHVDAAHGAAGANGTTALSSRAWKIPGRTSTMAAMTTMRMTPDATVTGRIPTAPAMAPWTTRPIG